jgi:hypothetical protein
VFLNVIMEMKYLLIFYTCYFFAKRNVTTPEMVSYFCISAINFESNYTEYTQKNGAVSMVNKGKPHHYFVHTLYISVKYITVVGTSYLFFTGTVSTDICPII